MSLCQTLTFHVGVEDRANSTAMGMPQKEVFENHILVMKEGNGASHFCYRGVANLIQFMAGGVNELWNVVA
jgi:hypothetical protein